MSSQPIEWISLREFARRCDRTHRACQKAIESYKIPAAAVRRDERGHIVAVELHRAAAAWRANTRPSAHDYQRAAPRPSPPAPRAPGPALDDVCGLVAKVLGIAFANALLPGCAMAVARWGLSPETALEVQQDLLLATMFATTDALGLEADDDRPTVLFHGDLEDALQPERRAELIERIRVMAEDYAAEDRAAAAVQSSAPGAPREPEAGR